MYLGLAAANPGPVLELAVGTGRIAVALAAAGHDVTGIDRDPDMLDRARRTWARRQRDGVVAGGTLGLVEADILDVRLERRFSLVIVALNSLLLLGDEESKSRALHTIERHLSSDGRVVIDIWLPTPDDLALYNGLMMLDWVRGDEETGQRVAKSWSAVFDPASNTATVNTYFDVGVDTKTASPTRRRDDIWFVGAQELVELVQATGLEPQTVAGDYALTPSTSQSERLVLICRKGTAPAGLL